MAEAKGIKLNDNDTGLEIPIPDSLIDFLVRQL